MPSDPSILTRFADGFRVGAWTVLPRSNEISRPGETVHVEPTPMHVLTLLAERAGETVTREELLDAVWPEVFVTENALSRSVSQLRKLLGDDARAPRFIETIPTVGYRLIAPVHHLGDGYTAPAAADDVALSIPTAEPQAEAETVTPPADRGFRVRMGWAWGLLALAAVALGVLAIVSSGQEPPVEPVTQPLTSAPGLETAPALSPDGSRVAYVHATDSTRGDLFVRVLGASAPLRLTDGPAADGSPAWAPDGRTVAFVRCEDQACGLFSVSALGGDVRRLAEGPALPGGLAFHPDGRRLALVARDTAGGPTSLVVLDLDTGTRRRLTQPSPTAPGDLLPMLSPDGTTVAFARRASGGGADLFRVPVAGGEPERLTSDGRALAGHGWTPDGRAILFSSNRTGMYELWRIPAAGGAPRRVTGIVARDPGRPAVTPGRLVFEEWAFEINLWGARADEAEPRPVVVSTWWDKHPHLRPDGERIAFISNRSGPPEVWVAERDGSNPTRLTDVGGASVEAPRWSPDGERIVFQARPETQADLFVIDAEGGTPRRLTPSDADEVAPRWSRDGQWVYFGSNRDGTWQLWKQPVAGGAAVRVTDAGGIVGEESSDGERVLYAKHGVPGLWARPVGGVPERLVTDALPAELTQSWAVTDTGVLFLARMDNGTEVRRLDDSTGEAVSLPLRLGRIMPAEPGLTATPDGRHLLVAQVDHVGSDLMHVEPFE